MAEQQPTKYQAFTLKLERGEVLEVIETDSMIESMPCRMCGQPATALFCALWFCEENPCWLAWIRSANTQQGRVG
jgi:Zn-finger protein